MRYEKIIRAKFIERPNRFVARVVTMEGAEKDREVIAHVKNTGRCRELLVPGATVYLEDFHESMGKRKLAYSLVGVEKGPLLINMDSQAPNKVVAEALKQGEISLPDMAEPRLIKGEKTHGDSRFDFYVEDQLGQKAFIEVKGVTLENEGVARFPDAPTERGVKHIHGLERALKEGYRAYIIFVIQMEGMRYFCPNDETHPEFGAALRQAAKSGVKILAYGCKVSCNELSVGSLVPVRL